MRMCASLFATETVTELRSTGNPEDAKAADIIEQSLASTASDRKGNRHQIVLLDREAGEGTIGEDSAPAAPSKAQLLEPRVRWRHGMRGVRLE